MKTIQISLIVPTRGRAAQMRRFLDSVRTNADAPGSMEIVMVVDSDDRTYDQFDYQGLFVKKVVVPAGMSMGALNMAGYRASAGRYLMLTNDDVIVRTKGWDEKVLKVFNAFPDEIVLVHVEDCIFHERLCTFPFVSRTYCEIADGICPEDYWRYRIDDHIYNVFNLLAVLQHKRIAYLPDVVFEHLNAALDSNGTLTYVPNPVIHAEDTKRFDNLLASRKSLAVALASRIADYRRSTERETWQKLLQPITDSVTLRKPEYIRTLEECRPKTNETRVTIGVVSADIHGDHPKICIDLLKKHTSNFELVLIDNNRSRDFNHSREMNRLLSMCRTDYLVLMDDDVWVSPGWLDGLLGAVGPEVGVVTPIHLDKNGDLSYAGVVMRPDASGHHSHNFRAPDSPVPIQTLCSAVMLIDMTKVGHLRVDESYSKYFLDIDYGLRVWEAGYKVMLAPSSICTHIGGATLAHLSNRSNELYEAQRLHWVKEWISTGRYERLMKTRWAEERGIRDLLMLISKISTLFVRTPGESIDRFIERALPIMQDAKHIPALLQHTQNRIVAAVNGKFVGIDDKTAGHLMVLHGLCGNSKSCDKDFDQYEINTNHAELVAEGYWKYNIVRFGSFYGIRQGDGAFDPFRARNGGYQDMVVGETESAVRLGIRGLWPAHIKYYVLRALKLAAQKLRRNDFVRTEAHGRNSLSPGGKNSSRRPDTISRSAASLQEAGASGRTEITAEPVVVTANYTGFAIVRFEHKYFCVPTGELNAGFEYEKYRQNGYSQQLVGHSLEEARRLIDDNACSRVAVGQSVLLMGSSNTSDLHEYARLLSRGGQRVTALLGDEELAIWNGSAEALGCGAATLLEAARTAAPLPPNIAGRTFDCAIVPWRFPDCWNGNAIESMAARICDRVKIAFTGGQTRTYFGENLHRIIYNKAYLSSMFQVVPPPTGSAVLEVGCSDGMVCDLFAAMGAKKVVGVDVMGTVGCGFPHPDVTYLNMDAENLDFADGTFDMTVSIATMEHVINPEKVITEMIRVTKPGGYIYIQAGPLYHSPHGHHMFAYFQDQPWIHLRMSTEEIIDYAKRSGIESRIERDLGMTAEQYIRGMLTREHVNGLFLRDYKLESIMARDDLLILKYIHSYEGDSQLNGRILSELEAYQSADLIAHGFELAIQRAQ